MPKISFATVPQKAHFCQTIQYAAFPRALPASMLSRKLQGLTTRAAKDYTGLSELSDILKSSLSQPSTQPTGSNFSQPTAQDAAGPAAPKTLGSAVDSISTVDKSKDAFSAAAKAAAESGPPSKPSGAENSTTSAAELSNPPSPPLEDAADKASKSLEQPPPVATSPGLPNPADTVSNSASEMVDAASTSVPNVAQQAAESSTAPPAAQALDSITSSITDVKDDLLGKASDASTSASQALQGVTEDLSKQLSGVSSDLSRQFEDVSGSLSKQFEALSNMTGDALGGAASQLDSSRDTALGVATSVGSQLNASANTLLESLPPPLRDAISAVAAPLSQALADPRIALPAVGAGVSIPALLWFSARFGGYSGLLSAEKALDILENENSLLVDIRSEDSRLVSGTPDLRFGARTRGVAIPLVQVSRRTGTQVIKAEILPYQLAAILVQGLNKVNKSTKIIIMDNSESKAIKLARAVSTETGLRAYVMQRGFRGWVAAGLPVKESIDYDTSTLDSIGDTLQGRVLPVLRDPVVGAGAISLGIISLAGIYDVHRTLQFIGVFAVLATVGTVPVRYNSLQEASDDLLGPFVRVANVVGQLGRFLPKPKPRLEAGPDQQMPMAAAMNGDSSSPEAEEVDHSSAGGSPEPVQAELVEDSGYSDYADAQYEDAKKEGENSDTQQPAKSNVL